MFLKIWYSPGRLGRWKEGGGHLSEAVQVAKWALPTWVLGAVWLHNPLSGQQFYVDVGGCEGSEQMFPDFWTVVVVVCALWYESQNTFFPPNFSDFEST